MKVIQILLLMGCGEKPHPSPDEVLGTATLCPIVLSHTTAFHPDSVSIVGDFNAWDQTSTHLVSDGDGGWSTTLDLAPGAYGYRFVETTDWEHGGVSLSLCDGDAKLAVCAEPTTHEDDWEQVCVAGEDDCDSLLIVPDCTQPKLSVSAVSIHDGELSVTGTLRDGAFGEASIRARLDGTAISVDLDGGIFHVEHHGLEAGRHHLELTAHDPSGHEAEPVAVPFWTDDWDWEQAVIYHALIDRVANGDPQNDAPSGTNNTMTDWAGGDLLGLKAALPYLDDLGINTIWISNPQPAPEGAWPGDCAATYSGYHGFWPTDWEGVDPHLGTMESLDAFIAAAHDRKIRVIMDLVANHVHTDHPRAANTTDFHPQSVCSAVGPDGASNWDTIPESCWFTDYLPDLDHSHPSVTADTIDMAVAWARDRRLDGFRIDAAKHMSTAVIYDLRSALGAALEHEGSGFDFNLVGETFDGEAAINRYIGEDLLHGQFDFPLYWALRSAFIAETISVKSVITQAAAMSEHYPGGRMSTFLGNLDVGRFVTEAAEQNTEVCPDGTLRTATPPDDDQAYARLALAWTVLFTQPGMPMIYYGDELGIPGYGDPDNRTALWWDGIDIMDTDVDTLSAGLAAGPARVLHTVQRLAAARATHPAFRHGEQIEWWDGGPSLYATAHRTENDQAIVVINRSDTEQWLDNGIAFAGLSGADWVELFSGDTVHIEDDRLVFSVPPLTSQVWLKAQ